MTDPMQPTPAEPPIDPAEAEAIQEAIVKAYPDPEDVDNRLYLKWGIRLREFVRTDLPTRKFVARLVEWADSEGRTRELVAVLWARKPRNPLLLAVAQRLLGDLDAVAARYALPPAPEQVTPLLLTLGNLEKVVNERSRLVDFGEFLSRLSTIGKSICRVEAAGEFGTGFLVGRQSVLTNYHVAKRAIDNGVDGGKILCRFDFERDEAGAEQAGIALPAAPGDSWLKVFSPYSDSDLSGSGSPKPNQLDFALIRLAEPVADRPALDFPAEPPIVAPLDIAIVVQHPGGDPLQIALGAVVELPATGLRYRYNTTTEPGASGSPVFSADARLIGLHHAADPAASPRYNQAVPIWRVARALEAAGYPPDSL